MIYEGLEKSSTSRPFDDSVKLVLAKAGERESGKLTLFWMRAAAALAEAGAGATDLRVLNETVKYTYIEKGGLGLWGKTCGSLWQL